MTTEIRCHYDVLSVARDADAATIKKSHRKLALKFHPDKNQGCDEAAKEFRLVQQAYECLSDPNERKWYDEHRDAILRGWDGTGDSGEGGSSFIFDVVPFQYAGCYDGYADDDARGFFAVYGMVFQKVYEGEQAGWVDAGNIDDMPHDLPTDFGNGLSDWSDVSSFYGAWEGFNSVLSFAFADKYDPRDAPNRRVRRAIEEENRKARRAAKRERNEDVLSLVRFVKRRDPRVKAYRERAEREKAEREEERKREGERRKAEVAVAREAWRAEAEKEMAETEANDLSAGRFRLADLDDDDDEFYGKKSKKRRGKKGKKGKKNRWTDEVDDKEENNGDDGNDQAVDDDQQNGEQIADTAATDSANAFGVDDSEGNKADCSPNGFQGAELSISSAQNDGEDDNSYTEEEEEEEPDFWRCECCRKDFKSDKQLENHLKSKKHKEAWKKYEKKLARMAKEEQEAVMDDLLDELALDP